MNLPAHRGTYYLHAGASLAPAGEVAGLPTTIHGQPVAYYWADAIRTGRYLHPATGQILDVDAHRLSRWLSNIRGMRAAGIDIPIPLDHSDRARDNMGYVLDARTQGPALQLLHQLVGADAIRMAARNKVSLGIDTDYRDGRGKAWGEAVIHSALTPVPVVPGQAGFVAASRGPANKAVAPPMFLLAASNTRSATMDAITPQDLIGIAALVGGEELTAQDALPALWNWAKDVSQRFCLSRTASEVDADLAAARQRSDAAERQLADAQAKVIELSRHSDEDMPQALALNYADLYSSKADHLVAAGHITPACRAKLVELIKPAGHPNLALLSRSPGSDARLIDAMFAALAENRAVEKGSRTGVQTLSRQSPSDHSELDPELHKTMVAMANGR
jgi:hypothetical protein